MKYEFNTKKRAENLEINASELFEVIPVMQLLNLQCGVLAINFGEYGEPKVQLAHEVFLEIFKDYEIDGDEWPKHVFTEVAGVKIFALVYEGELEGENENKA